MAHSEDLAADLGIDEGDVRALLRQLGEQTPEVPDGARRVDPADV